MTIVRGEASRTEIRRRLLVIFVIIALIGLVIAFGVLQLERQTLTGGFEDFGFSIAMIAEHIIEHDMLEQHGVSLLASRLQDIGSAVRTIEEIAVISPELKIFAGYPPSLTGESRVEPEIAALFTTGEPAVDRKEVGEKSRVGILYPILNRPSCQTCHDAAVRTLGVVEVHLSTRELEAQIAGQTIMLGTAGGLVILLVGATSYFLLRRTVLKPLSNHIDHLVAEKEKAKSLYAADRLASIGELSAGVAHEINNPLTSVIGFSDLILQDEENIPEGLKEKLTIINSEAIRASEIVKGLLTFARRHSTVKESVNVNDVINNVLKMREYEQQVHNIAVVTSRQADLPLVKGDPFELQQVFLNIIINAEYFMNMAHHKGNLTIKMTSNNDNVRVSIADDGPGISKESLARIFEPFYTTKEVGKGTGLGLSIVQGIVSEHGGSITAESELGKGATFIVELPVSRDGNERAA